MNYLKNIFLFLFNFASLKTIIVFGCLFFGIFTKTMEQNEPTVWKDIDGTFKQLYYQSFSPNIPDSYTIFTGLTDQNIIKTIACVNDKIADKKYVINDVNQNHLNITSSLISEPKKIYYLPPRTDKVSNDGFEYYFAYVDKQEISLLKNRGITYNYEQNKNLDFYNTSYKHNLLYKNITSHETAIKNIFSFSHQYTEKFSSFRKTFSKGQPKTYDVFGVISTSEYPSLKRTMFYFEHQKNQPLSIDQKVMDNNPGYSALAVHENKMLYYKENSYPTGIFGGIARSRLYKNRKESGSNDNSFKATLYIHDIVKTDHSFYPLSKGTVLTDDLQISYNTIPLATMNEKYAVICTPQKTNEPNFKYTCTVFKLAQTKKQLFTIELSPDSKIISPMFMITSDEKNYFIVFDKNNIHYFYTLQSDDKAPKMKKKNVKSLLNGNTTLGDITACTYDPDKNMFYVVINDEQTYTKSNIAEIPFTDFLFED